MTDRDPSAANSPEPEDDVLREPSRAELDEAIRARAERAQADDRADRAEDDAAEQADALPVAPEAYDEPYEPVRREPSRGAVIAGAILAALLLGLTILAFTQDPRSYMTDINREQIAGVARVVEDQDIAEYNADEVRAAQEAWAAAGSDRDMTSDTAAQALNAARPDSINAGQIDDALGEIGAQFQTLQNLEDGLRSQTILFAVTGGLAALATVFYQRRQTWARVVGMFVSGFVAVMYVMQVVQGALNIPGMLLVVASVSAFYLFMKGRLDDPMPARAGGGLGLGGSFGPRAPRAPRQRPTE